MQCNVYALMSIKRECFIFGYSQPPHISQVWTMGRSGMAVATFPLCIVIQHTNVLHPTASYSIVYHITMIFCSKWSFRKWWVCYNIEHTLQTLSWSLSSRPLAVVSIERICMQEVAATSVSRLHNLSLCCE